MSTGPSFDKIYTDLALGLAAKSHCSRLQVGCVIASWDNQRILSIGYNGSWRGGPNRCDSNEPGACGCIHAEQNAMIKLDYNDTCRKRLYTTVSPCSMCAKFIINAGISEVVYVNEYRNIDGLKILWASGTSVRQFKETVLDLKHVPWSKEKEITESWKARLDKDGEDGGVRVELRASEVQGSGSFATCEVVDEKPRDSDPIQDQETSPSVPS